MSDATNPTPAPDAGAGAATTPTPVDAQQPDAGATQPAGQPFAVFPTATAFNERLQRETRKELDVRAKALGFETWQAFEQSRTNPPATETPAAQTPADPPAATPAPVPVLDEVARLRLAVKVAAEKNLPPALIARLQGNTPDEMAADAETLLGLVQRPPSGPGIPPAPRGAQTTTFTRAQLRDPAFVRQHAVDIQRAAREGRIVDG